MNATSLKLFNFRNISDETIEFSDGVNIIWGENAQGKTNILEALWFFSVGKSFRASRDKEIIAFGEQKTQAELVFTSNGREQLLKAEIPETGRKKIHINGIKAIKASEIIGNFNSVLFSPEHLSLVKDGSSERRKFLDCAITQLRPGYVDLLLNYQKILDQKNAALKKSLENKSYMDTLDIWDEKLSTVGAKITKAREKYIEMLIKKAQLIHFDISDNTEKLSLKYNSSTEEKQNEENAAKELLKLQLDNRKTDILRGCTSTGPHRDDFEILINNIAARKFASQGQQRSCVLSLKIAESMILEEEYSEQPVLLLDDVLSELDSQRQNYILEKIGRGQVIITCCETEKFLSTLKSAKTLHVEGGKIIR